MEAEPVIEGEQLLYTNEFDELTYNADKIVEMTSQLDEVLKRFSYSFSSKDSALIINKNLTAFLYWFVIDALYFPQSATYEVQRVNHLRNKKHLNRSSLINSSDPFEEEKFITKMRLLAIKNHNLTTLKEINQTSVDQIIDLFEKQHQNIIRQNDELLDKFSAKVASQKDRFYNRIKELEVDPKEGSPLLVYYNFQKQMIRDWMEQVENKRHGVRCQICCRTDKIIKCKECNLYVHSYCYPKLPKYYNQKEFLCQNCQKDLSEKTDCIFCPIKGGYFLEVDYPSKRPIYSIFNFIDQAISKSEGLKLKIKRKQLDDKKKYLHLSCSLWHPQIEYNVQKGRIMNTHRVDRKKTQNSCYECGTNIGVTIPCANQNCRRFYHPECAKKIDLGTCIINAKNKLLIELHCDRHGRPPIFEILKQNILNKLKEIKKLYEGIDHEIKRMQSSSFPSDRKISLKNNDQTQRYDWCIYCRQVQEDWSIPITNCCKCYNWYHKHCANRCLFCDIPSILPQGSKV